MSARTDELAGRRRQLVSRSQRLRLEFADEAGAITVRFRLADRMTALARSGAVQAAAVAAAALMLFGRPRRLFRTAGRLLVLWPLVRSIYARLKPLLRGEPT